MPRKPREEEAGAIHHVFARGNRKQLIFHDDVDRQSYLLLLGRTAVRKNWNLLAYCLMPNHVHLVVETVDPNLGSGMQRLHGVYAQTFNARHGLVGHVFQGRYGSKRLKTEAHLWETIRYVARNPVAAGLAASAESWPWSSHGAVTGTRPAPDWLATDRVLDLLSAAGGDPLHRYLAAVSDDVVADDVVATATTAAATTTATRTQTASPIPTVPPRDTTSSAPTTADLPTRTTTAPDTPAKPPPRRVPPRERAGVVAAGSDLSGLSALVRGLKRRRRRRPRRSDRPPRPPPDPQG